MILCVENGSFKYPHRTRQVLDKISCGVEAGDILAILGPNGAGKTTLLKCTMGLLRWQTGRTLLAGRELSAMKEQAIWQLLSYVPQARTASAAYSVEEMVLLGRSSRIGRFSLPGKEDVLKAEEALERLGLTPLKKARCSEISGGELQMVLIARALASEPRVLILDEPESNLDFRNQLVVLDAMTALSKQGIACIFNTHYPAHALRIASKSLLLARDGSFRFGATADTLTDESISSVFGVQAVIGEISTPYGNYRDVIPITLK